MGKNTKIYDYKGPISSQKENNRNKNIIGNIGNTKTVSIGETALPRRNFQNDFNRQKEFLNSDRSIYGDARTIIKNVGTKYFSLPPGHAVRAHIQNIDLIPYGDRKLSPSEALEKLE